MIQFRIKENGNTRMVNLSNYQKELVTDDGILNFLGERGIILELRNKTCVFAKDDEVVNMLTRELEEDEAEIYMYDESSEDDKYCIVINDLYLSKICGYNKISAVGCTSIICRFLSDIVVTDNDFLPVLTPEHLRYMFEVAYVFNTGGADYDPYIMKEMFSTRCFVNGISIY